MNEWIHKNWKELKTICHKISRQDNVDDLFQMCVEQFLTNKKVKDIPNEQKFYFFTKIVRNQSQSKTSRYYIQYKKFQFQEFPNIEVEDIPYSDNKIDLDWVKLQIENDKKGEDWYFARIFELYIEEKCLLKDLSKRTSIPKASLSRDVNRYRNILKERRINYLKLN